MNNQPIPLNQILYGPPGTGKTYTTIAKAIQIINPNFNLNQERHIVKEEFNRLLNSNLIRFVTFHQSFSYEDFVEGIKPIVVTNNINKDEVKDVVYEIQDGVFKELCKKSKEKRQGEVAKEKKIINLSETEFTNTDFYKLSLGDSTNRDNDAIYEYCIENSCIAIGFGEMTDFSGKKTSEIYRICEENGLTSYTPIALNYFIHYLKHGDYVLISNGNRSIRAMGQIVGNYYYNENAPIEYHHFREVKWIFYNEDLPANELYEKSLSQQTIYKLQKGLLNKEFFVPRIKNPKQDEINNYVFIIDEINRGNIASIFGELITLIEEDKREGKSEELNTILPYSKETFSVPNNIYIIGTMNTADRSVEALDIALRRRFNFIEVAPNTDLIDTIIEVCNGEINLKDLIDIINLRIEKLLDKDHKIGHAYFMTVKSEADLKDVFADKVIPLLEEYFFGDFSKIGLILGQSFIRRTEVDTNFKFATFDNDADIDLLDKPIYELTSRNEWDFKSVL